MTTVNIREMGQDLASYLRRVQSGETLLVLEEGQPLAGIKLTPNDVAPERKPRP